MTSKTILDAVHETANGSLASRMPIAERAHGDWVGVFSAVVISYPHSYPPLRCPSDNVYPELGVGRRRAAAMDSEKRESAKGGEQSNNFIRLDRRSVIPSCGIRPGDCLVYVMFYKSVTTH